MVRCLVLVLVCGVFAWMFLGPHFSGLVSLSAHGRSKPYRIPVQGFDAAGKDADVRVNGHRVPAAHLLLRPDFILLRASYFARLGSGDLELLIEAGDYSDRILLTGEAQVDASSESELPVSPTPMPRPRAPRSDPVVRDVSREQRLRVQNVPRDRDGLRALKRTGGNKTVFGVNDLGEIRAGAGMKKAEGLDDYRSSSLLLVKWGREWVRGRFEVALEYSRFDDGAMALNLGPFRLLLPLDPRNPSSSLVQAINAESLTSTCGHPTDDQGRAIVVFHSDAFVRGQGWHKLCVACEVEPARDGFLLAIEVQVDSKLWTFRAERKTAPHFGVLVEGLRCQQFGIRNVTLTETT
jgi:hypothetical protein